MWQTLTLNFCALGKFHAYNQEPMDDRFQYFCMTWVNSYWHITKIIITAKLYHLVGFDCSFSKLQIGSLSLGLCTSISLLKADKGMPQLRLPPVTSASIKSLSIWEYWYLWALHMAQVWVYIHLEDFSDFWGWHSCIKWWSRSFSRFGPYKWTVYASCILKKKKKKRVLN